LSFTRRVTLENDSCEKVIMDTKHESPQDSKPSLERSLLSEHYIVVTYFSATVRAPLSGIPLRGLLVWKCF